jgi:hypothetical protein
MCRNLVPGYLALDRGIAWDQEVEESLGVQEAGFAHDLVRSARRDAEGARVLVGVVESDGFWANLRVLEAELSRDLLEDLAGLALPDGLVKVLLEQGGRDGDLLLELADCHGLGRDVDDGLVAEVHQEPRDHPRFWLPAVDGGVGDQDLDVDKLSWDVKLHVPWSQQGHVP